MKFYELTYILEDEQEEKLLVLTERYRRINGWNEKDLLQFAVTALNRLDMDKKLQFLENRINQLEEDNE